MERLHWYREQLEEMGKPQLHRRVNERLETEGTCKQEEEGPGNR
jgi:hypothetical protein